MVVTGKRRPVSVVVAVCKQSRGIGNAGQLPWRLRADMAFFKQLTRSTRDPCKRNAVIMGRKTWQSIPARFRPLDDRVNIVLSRSATAAADLELPAGVVHAESLDKALELLDEASDLGGGVETVYVIGGSSVYAEALALPAGCARLHVTEVERVPTDADQAIGGGAENAGNVVPGAASDKPAAFECDAFFPAIDERAFGVSRTAAPRDEGGLRYTFVEYTPRSADLKRSATWSGGGAGSGGGGEAALAGHEEDQYLDLVREVIASGVRRDDRTGVGTLSKFGVQMRFDLSEKVSATPPCHGGRPRAA